MDGLCRNNGGEVPTLAMNVHVVLYWIRVARSDMTRKLLCEINSNKLIIIINTVYRGFVLTDSTSTLTSTLCIDDA